MYSVTLDYIYPHLIVTYTPPPSPQIHILQMYVYYERDFWLYGLQ